jgi:hypothetical protein
MLPLTRSIPESPFSGAIRPPSVQSSDFSPRKTAQVSGIRSRLEMSTRKSFPASKASTQIFKRQSGAQFNQNQQDDSGPKLPILKHLATLLRSRNGYRAVTDPEWSMTGKMKVEVRRIYEAFGRLFPGACVQDPESEAPPLSILVMKNGERSLFVGSDGIVMVTVGTHNRIRSGRYRIEGGTGVRELSKPVRIRGFKKFLSSHDEVGMSFVGSLDPGNLSDFLSRRKDGSEDKFYNLYLETRFEIGEEGRGKNNRRPIGKMIHPCEPLRISNSQMIMAS